MPKEESVQSDPKGEPAKGLQRPPDSAVETEENFLGATGDETGNEAEAPDQEAQSSEESAPEGSDKPGEKKRRGSSRDRKIKRLTRRAATAEERAAELEARLQQAEAQLEQVRADTAPKKPKLQDFDTEEEYALAYSDWLQKNASQPKKGQQRQAAKATKAEVEAIGEFVSEGKEALGEAFTAAWERCTKNEFIVDQETAEFLFESNFGPQMFVELSKRPKLANQILNEKGLGKLEMLQDLEIRTDPNTRPAEPKKRGKDGKFVSDGSGERQETKAPPPGPAPERGGPAATGVSLYKRIENSQDLRSQDLAEIMKQRRALHERR